MTSALITGGRGFIGRSLAKKLRGAFTEVMEWDRDLLGLASFEKPVDVVFHLAARSRHDQFEKNILEGFETNVLGTEAVLQYCQRVRARLVFASTSGIYKTSKANLLLTEESPVGPQSHYPLSKRLAERLCEQASLFHQLPIAVLRIFNPYGPNQHPSFLIPQAVARLVEGSPILLRMPHAIRDFVYVDDVAEALIKAALAPLSGFEIFNVATGFGSPILEVLELIAKLLDKPLKLEKSSPHDGELAVSVGDAKKAKEKLGWTPQYNLEAGLRQWISKNY